MNFNARFWPAFIALSAWISIYSAAAADVIERPGDPVGHGDGRIHIIPSLSSPSIKNGQQLTVCAIVKAAAGVQSVTADLGGIETLALSPDAKMGGTDAGATVGIWSAVWQGRGLQEKIYTLTITATDRLGHSFVDSSLAFSDPAAGLSTPGTQIGPNGGMRYARTDLPFLNAESGYCTVIDSASGTALLSSGPSVLKIALGGANQAPARVGQLLLTDGDGFYFGLLDAASGTALFCGRTSALAGVVVKIALGAPAAPPTLVGRLVLNSGEQQVRCGVLNSATGEALLGVFGTVSDSILKVSVGAATALPVRGSAVALTPADGSPLCAVLDAAHNVALFGTSGAPGNVVKILPGVAGAVPQKAGTVAMNSGENDLLCAVFDPATGVALFGTQTDPGIVVKVAPGIGNALPSRIGAVALPTGENELFTAVLDAANNVALFGTFTSPGKVVKVSIGAANAAPAQVAALDLNPGEMSNSGGAFDPVTGAALFASSSPSRVTKVTSGSAGGAPVRVGSLMLYPGDQSTTCAVFDAASGTALIAGGTTNSTIVKLSLGAPNMPPVRIGAVVLDATESPITCGVLDAASGIALFGAQTTPGAVVKIALGPPASAPVRVGGVSLAGVNYLNCAVLDAANGVALFGNTFTNPGMIAKVALGTPNAAPALVGSVTLNAQEGSFTCAVFDAASGTALFGTSAAMSTVVKVALNAANAAPTRVGAATFSEQYLQCGVLDAANGVALFGARNAIVKVALGAPASAPTRVGAAAINSLDPPASAVFDPARGTALFGGSGSVVKVAAGLATDAPAVVGSLNLNASNLPGAFLDSASGRAFFVSSINAPTNSLITVNYQQYSNIGYVTATKMVLPEDAFVNAVRFYSHAASGNLRLGIYDVTGANLIWQSGLLANTAANAEVSALISGGTPARLRLLPGTYFLAYQSDSAVTVASFTAGVPGDGFEVAQSFGPFPAVNSAPSIAFNANRYTEYITYSVYTAPVITTFASPDNPGTASLNVAYNLTATSTTSTTLNYAVDFGDGTAPLPGTVQQGVNTVLNHTYAAPGNYTVKAAVDDGFTTSAKEVAQSVAAPAPPVIVSLSTDDNPGLIGTDIVYSFSATSNQIQMLFYTLDFGDGQTPIFGTFQQGAALSASHVYTATGSFTVTLTVTDSVTAVSATVVQAIPTPASGALGVKNISDITIGGLPAVNPVAFLASEVSASNGGVLRYGINPTNAALGRANMQLFTEFADGGGNSTIVFGFRPVHRFTISGVFVAKTTVFDPVAGTVIGRARKMVTVSAKETGHAPSARAPGDPTSTAISTKALNGKFNFAGSTSDVVSFSGTIVLPSGLDTSKPHALTIGIGNIVADALVNAKGNGVPATIPSPLKKLKVLYKVKHGAVTTGGETALITLNFTLAKLVENGFDTEGIVKSAPDVSPKISAPRKIQISMNLDGVPYETQFGVMFSVTPNSDFGSIAGRSGKP